MCGRASGRQARSGSRRANSGGCGDARQRIARRCHSAQPAPTAAAVQAAEAAAAVALALSCWSGTQLTRRRCGRCAHRDRTHSPPAPLPWLLRAAVKLPPAPQQVNCSSRTPANSPLASQGPPDTVLAPGSPAAKLTPPWRVRSSARIAEIAFARCSLPLAALALCLTLAASPCHVPLKYHPQPHQMLLLSDGSVTRHLELLTGRVTTVVS